MKQIIQWGLISLLLGMLGACSSADDGMLKISSDPYDAEVYIDGERKGNTPAKKGQTYAIKLAEGDYTIEIIKPINNDGKPDEYDQYYGSKKVFVAEGVLQTITVELRRRQSEAFKKALLRRVKMMKEACRYKPNSNGTVTDKTTGLMWKQCSEGLNGASCENGKAKQYTWDAATGHLKRLSFAGYSDWRLPAKDELLSVARISCGSPTLNEQLFPNTETTGYWSSSVYLDNDSYAWFVFLGNGGDGVHLKSFTNYVRLVRGGN